jgi:hypothetical protein
MSAGFDDETRIRGLGGSRRCWFMISMGAFSGVPVLHAHPLDGTNGATAITRFVPVQGANARWMATAV